MKKYILLSFSLLFALNICGQSTDEDAVIKTLNYYLDGGTNNDFETLKKAFHEDATMKYIRGDYTAVNALEFFGSRMKPGPAQKRECEITYMDVSGPAAHARIEIKYEEFMFVDYMNLLKIDGEWKIVSKIFNRVTFDE
ncbi:MAG: hypothetical protein HKN09_00515 [Saprospiraceae bacterium]|nr:hypothetical protein [Saprospiraceae bacterium]